jgi:outer membrane lipoprotein carrier protein
MRWEYRSPETKLAVVDGARTWLYIPAENQVIVGDLDEVHRSGAAGLLLAGTVNLTRDFEIRPGPEEDDPGPGTAVLTLTPRRPSGEFDRIDVTVSLETDLPVRIRVHAPLGDVMEYRLAGVRTGMPLDPSLFQFTPPEGVEVVLAE